MNSVKRAITAIAHLALNHDRRRRPIDVVPNLIEIDTDIRRPKAADADTAVEACCPEKGLYREAPGTDAGAVSGGGVSASAAIVGAATSTAASPAQAGKIARVILISSPLEILLRNVHPSPQLR